MHYFPQLEEIHLQTTESHFCSNYPAHVVCPEAFHPGPQTTPRPAFPSFPLVETGSLTAVIQHKPLFLRRLCSMIEEDKDHRVETECWSREGVWAGNRQRETRTSTVCSDREMTSGHPEASGLSDCLGKPRAHLMTPGPRPVGFF